MKKVGFAARLMAIVAVLSLAAFAVAGCGSEEKKQDTVSSDQSATTATSGETKQYKAGDTVGESKKVIVKSDADFTAEQQAVIDRIGEFADATSSHDYEKLCNDLLSKEAAKIGGDCVKTFKQTGAQITDFTIAVKSVKVGKDGKTATAVVDVSSNVNKQKGQNLSLAKQNGEWRIQILGQ